MNNIFWPQPAQAQFVQAKQEWLKSKNWPEKERETNENDTTATQPPFKLQRVYYACM